MGGMPLDWYICLLYLCCAFPASETASLGRKGFLEYRFEKITMTMIFGGF